MDERGFTKVLIVDIDGVFIIQGTKLGVIR
jgi:hypothetical protein